MFPELSEWMGTGVFSFRPCHYNDCREGWRESDGLCAVKIRIRNLQMCITFRTCAQNPLFKNIVTSTSLGNGDERTELGSSAEHDTAKWTTGSTHQLKPQQSEKTQECTWMALGSESIETKASYIKIKRQKRRER